MEISSPKIVKKDKQILEKYIRFLCYKTIQVIVKSKTGQRFYSKSKPLSYGAHWFNLDFEDNEELLNEIKHVMEEKLPSYSSNLCIEIYLKTCDGDILVLELWTLGLSEPCVPNSINNVYRKMGLIMKSLMCICKNTPASRLIAQSSSSHYSICYRIFMGDPNFETLGENFEEYKIGSVNTALGIVHLTLDCRTKLILEPKPIAPLVATNDYFVTSDGDKVVQKEDALSVGSNKNSKIEGASNGDGVNSLKNSFIIENFDSDQDCDESDIWVKTQPGPFVPNSSESSFREGVIPELMFQHLLPKSEDSSMIKSLDLNNNSGMSEKSLKDEVAKIEAKTSESDSDNSVAEDFVLVEMKAPFAEPSSNTFGTFFSEFPSLQSFNDLSLEDQVTEFNTQLEKIENEQPEMDKFVDSLCHIENYV